MDIKYCDLCKKKINEGDKVYNLNYSKKSSMSILSFMDKGDSSCGEICNICMDKVINFVRGLKKEMK